MGAKRLTYIETMRGLACLLLVSWHVVGEREIEGLNLPLDHPLHLLGEFFIPLRMPLFAFISGFVFAAVARDWGEAGGKVGAKARRLLLPLFFVGTLHFLLRALAYDGDFASITANIWKVYFGSYEHFWYLQATFVIMAVVLAVNALNPGNPLRAGAICLAAAVPLYLIEMNLHPVNWFSITKVFYLAPFFLAGQLLRNIDFDKRLSDAPQLRQRLLIGLGAAITALYALRVSGAAPFGLEFRLHSIWMLALSAALCAFLFSLKWENKWLAKIGPYSYAIFLFHVIFTAGFRFFEVRVVHEHSPYVIWALSLVVGVAGPIVVAEALRRGPPILETLFLGVRTTPRRRGAPTKGDPAALPPREEAA